VKKNLYKISVLVILLVIALYFKVSFSFDSEKKKSDENYFYTDMVDETKDIDEYLKPLPYETAPIHKSTPERPKKVVTTPEKHKKVIKQQFICDGRKYCSQMNSCEEAMFFLNHCEDVKMDGDEDGIPCERQWCNNR